MRFGAACAATCTLSALLAVLAFAADVPHENLFGTIRVDGKKIGQVHYTVSYGEDGAVEELRSNASYSVLGFELYHFSQDLEERWKAGALQSFEGTTNRNGERFQGQLTRDPDHYAAILNGEALTLPHDAFPASVWHFGITKQTRLFSLADFELMTTSVSERPETVVIDGRNIETTRFDFTGEWEATLWFDGRRQVVKFEYPAGRHTVSVTLDQD